MRSAVDPKGEVRPRCIGFGEFDNRRKDGPGCENLADANSALLWCTYCTRCEVLRLRHITEQFAENNENRSDSFDKT